MTQLTLRLVIIVLAVAISRNSVVVYAKKSCLLLRLSERAKVLYESESLQFLA